MFELLANEKFFGTLAFGFEPDLDFPLKRRQTGKGRLIRSLFSATTKQPYSWQSEKRVTEGQIWGSTKVYDKCI